GAASLAGLMQERGRMTAKRVAVILSGGNIDAAVYRRILAGETPKTGLGDCPPTPPQPPASWGAGRAVSRAPPKPRAAPRSWRRGGEGGGRWAAPPWPSGQA